MSTKPPRPSVPRLDPDTLSSSLGIRPSDVKAAVREERHKNEMEWIVIYWLEGDLLRRTFDVDGAAEKWLEADMEDAVKAFLIGPVPRGTKVENRT